MIITGFPRSGSTLLFLLIANSCINRVCVRKNRIYQNWNDAFIAKDPNAYLRVVVKEPLYLVRDIRAVLTSTTHKRFKNKPGFGWDQSISGASMQEHCLKLPDEPLWWYEDLCRDPDGFQDKVAKTYNLEFDKRWSDWPFQEFIKPFHPRARYWHKALGLLAPIRKARKASDKFLPRDLFEREDFQLALERFTYH